MPSDAHCPVCGYTQEDEAIHGDHHLCSGKIPMPDNVKRLQRWELVRSGGAYSEYREMQRCEPYVGQEPDQLDEWANAADVAPLEEENAALRAELDEFRCHAHGAHNPVCAGCMEEQAEKAESQNARLVAMLRRAKHRLRTEFLRGEIEALLAEVERLRRAPCEDCGARQPCGHHVIHERSVTGIQSDGQEGTADWCEVCEEQIGPLRAEVEEWREAASEIPNGDADHDAPEQECLAIWIREQIGLKSQNACLAALLREYTDGFAGMPDERVAALLRGRSCDRAYADREFRRRALLAEIDGGAA